MHKLLTTNTPYPLWTESVLLTHSPPLGLTHPLRNSLTMATKTVTHNIEQSYEFLSISKHSFIVFLIHVTCLLSPTTPHAVTLSIKCIQSTFKLVQTERKFLFGLDFEKHTKFT